MPTRTPTTPDSWPFDQPRDAAAITLRRIVLPKNGEPPKPVLYVLHDADDHSWQFLDGDHVRTEDAAVVGMETMLNHDPSLAEIADLPPGWIATRAAPGKPWRRSRRG